MPCSAGAGSLEHADVPLVCVAAAQALSVTQEERVKFWCLQTLVDLVKGGRYGALAEHEQAAMRTSLLAWAQSKGAPQVRAEPEVATTLTLHAATPGFSL
eukprot:6182216-Pleurochrysis_carterae.AAC.2